MVACAPGIWLNTGRQAAACLRLGNLRACTQTVTLLLISTFAWLTASKFYCPSEKLYFLSSTIISRVSKLSIGLKTVKTYPLHKWLIFNNEDCTTYYICWFFFLSILDFFSLLNLIPILLNLPIDPIKTETIFKFRICCDS